MKQPSHLTATRGFTIVELLIVVVIIAILAAITIVAYSSMQTRAKNSAAQSTLNTFSKKLQMYYQLKGSYPATVATVATSLNTYTESALPTNGPNIGTPTANTGTNTTQLEVCGPTNGGPYGQGMRLTAWDYTTNAPSTTPTSMGVTTYCSTS